MARYGQRTGVTTLKHLVKGLCHLYLGFKPWIDAWVIANVPNIPEPNREMVLGWLNQIVTVCNILNPIADD